MIIKKYKEKYFRFNEKGIRLERFFVIMAIVLGICYMIINTPNTAYDERSHYISAYHYSDVLMGYGFSMEDGTFVMRNEDAKILEFSDFVGMETYRQLGEQLSFLETEEGNTEFTYGIAGNFWQYIPQTIGLTIGRLLHLGHIPTYYFARLLNLAFFIFLVYCAISILPFGKMTMTLLALMPICMQQAASMSYDASLYGAAFLFTAVLLKLAFETSQITKKQIIIACISAWFMGAQKMGIYVLLCTLLFLIPMKKFKNTGRWLGCIVLIGGCYVISFLLNPIIYSYFFPCGGTESLSPDYVEKVTYTLADLLADPIGFLGIIGNSIIEKGHYYWTSLFGSHLGSYALTLPDIYCVELLLILFFSVIPCVKDEKKQFVKYPEWGHRIWFLAIFLLQWMIYWVSFYLSVTPKGEQVIWGVQGRYFVPVVFLFFMFFRGNKLSFKRNYDRTICTCYVVVSVLIVLIIGMEAVQAGDAIRVMNTLGG